jgi:hypothetical protein
MIQTINCTTFLILGIFLFSISYGQSDDVCSVFQSLSWLDSFSIDTSLLPNTSLPPDTIDSCRGYSKTSSDDTYIYAYVTAYEYMPGVLAEMTSFLETMKKNNPNSLSVTFVTVSIPGIRGCSNGEILKMANVADSSATFTALLLTCFDHYIWVEGTRSFADRVVEIGGRVAALNVPLNE